MGSFNSTIFLQTQTMLKLALLCLMAAVYSEAGLVTYPNGAVVPYDPANIAATNAHLATTYPRFGGYHGLGYPLVGKRSAEAEAEADPGLVAYSNGAVVPYYAPLHGSLGYGYHGGVYGYPYWG